MTNANAPNAIAGKMTNKAGCGYLRGDGRLLWLWFGMDPLRLGTFEGMP